MVYERISVIVMDDEYFSLYMLMQLLQRNPFLDLLYGCSSPEALFSYARKARKPVVFLIDAEFTSKKWSLQTLLDRLNVLSPQSCIMILSQYSRPEDIDVAARAKVKGFLHKEDIGHGYGVASALRETTRAKYVYTPTVEHRLRQNHRHWVDQGTCLPIWGMPMALSAREQQTLEAIYLNGVSPKMFAARLMVAQQTVSGYKYRARERVFDAYDNGYYREDPQLKSMIGSLTLDQLATLILQGLPQ